MTVDGGRLVEATGPEGARLLELLRSHGEEATTIAELGIGTNENAELTGHIIEDEKLLGTAHIAFGASEAIGGRIQVPVHLDSVIMRPVVAVDGHVIVRDGELLLCGPVLRGCSRFPTSPKGPRPRHRHLQGGFARIPSRSSTSTPTRSTTARSSRSPAATRRSCARCGISPARRSTRSTSPASGVPIRGSARSTSARSSGRPPTSATTRARSRCAVAEQLGSIGLPVFLYGELASTPERRERSTSAAAVTPPGRADGGRASCCPTSAPAGRTRRPAASSSPPARRSPPSTSSSRARRSAGAEIAAGLRESGGGPEGVRAIAIELGEAACRSRPTSMILSRCRSARRRGDPPARGRARRERRRGRARRARSGRRARRLPPGRADRGDDPHERTIEAKLSALAG